ncbi:MAG: hypothetical protein DI551_00200 [Micavibrio aeruginosavorus]|uniref:Uncharacterized protein n=1 Tax=Micavibrio aeruginosavorus TaxID=349221 RepID=A0A2W5PWA1_9BACT|nr:MAG: hypothetical protein DI551_00200 [Micavibrio aeruginosavorus]
MEDEQDDKHQGQFSLFEGDLVNRAFAKLGIGARKPLDLLARIVLLIGITWCPMAVMASFTVIPDALPEDARIAMNFFYDFAAYTQFFIGLPLFIIAEKILSDNILAAARDFEGSGIVSAQDRPKLRAIEDEVARLRRKASPEIICFIIAFVLSLMTIGPELFWPGDAMQTWHVAKDPVSHARNFTMTGAWETFVALPIQIFWWVRWIWKIGLWYWYLRQVSKFKLVLVASHPDHTGGIGFLSETQAKFAIVILAFGVSNIVSTIGYKIAVEHAPLDLPPVWGPVVGFVIGAPLIFLSPLLLFTKQLARTKKRAMDQFRERAMAAALRVEEQWLNSRCANDECDVNARGELSQLNLLSGFYDRIHGMRVIPFDLRSALQLTGSAVGPMIPLLPYFVKLPEPWQAILEAMTKWLPH